MNKSKNYFKSLFSSVNIFTTLLLICLAMTAIVANYEFGIVGAATSTKAVLIFTLTTAGIGLILLLTYLCISAKAEKTTLADNIALASIIVGVALIAYFALTNGIFNLRRTLAIVACLIFGFIYLMVRVHNFGKAKQKEYAPHSIKGYYATIVKKYPLPLIIVLSGLILCVVFLALSSGFVRVFFRADRLLTLIACIILVFPIIAWVIKSVFKTSVNFADALLVCAIPVFPISLMQIIFASTSSIKMLAWAVALAIYLIVMFIRLSKFDLSKKNDAVVDYSGNYLRCVSSKYSLLDVLALASSMALIVFVMLKTSVLYNSILFLIKGKMAYRMLPILAISLFAFGVIAVCSLGALVGVKNKDIEKSDFMLMTLIAFALATIIVYTVDKSVYLLFAVALLVVYSLILALVRIITLRKR